MVDTYLVKLSQFEYGFACNMLPPLIGHERSYFLYCIVLLGTVRIISKAGFEFTGIRLLNVRPFRKMGVPKLPEAIIRVYRNGYPHSRNTIFLISFHYQHL